MARPAGRRAAGARGDATPRVAECRREAAAKRWALAALSARMLRRKARGGVARRRAAAGAARAGAVTATAQALPGFYE